MIKESDSLRYIRVPFIISSVIMMLSFFIHIFLGQYEVQGLYRKLLLGIMEISLSIIIIFAAAAFAFNIIKNTSKIKRIFVVLIFPIVAVLIFAFGFKTTYNTTSDLITRNTEDVTIKNIKVTKSTSGRGGTSYTITGYDLNDKKTSFDIGSGAYEELKDKSKVNIKIICYEKSRVIYDMYSFE